MDNLLEYKLPKDAYVNFDALSLKDFIIQKLNENPQFTDQNYEGSNLSSFIDVIAFSYHVLLFYLNQTSSETMFSQTNLYENMNRIVNLVGYKPTGKQTSLLSVDAVASGDLTIGSYRLRKYSYFLIDRIQYTILEDLIFSKNTPTTENISTISENLILYQGVVKEYPTYIALGDDYESIPIVVDNIVDDKKFIAANGISVFVKEVNTGRWFRYNESQNLYLSGTNDRICDIRLNENGHYEIKFGNGIFGKKLDAGDEVVIFYILSDGERGVVSKNSLNGKKLFNYNNLKFSEIYQELDNNQTVNIDANNNSSIIFRNPLPSSPISMAESVKEIRENVPVLNNANIRLVTEMDYNVYITKEFPNIINSVKTSSNDRYMNEYLRYFYDICVDPNKTTRVILNNVNFADSCDFNNVNIFTVPKFNIKRDASYPPYLSNSFKNILIERVQNIKMISHEIVPRDPVYMAFDVGFSTMPANLNTAKTSKIEIVRTPTNKINGETLKRRIRDVIIEFFNPNNNKLGQKLDIAKLTSDILTIEGVETIRTNNNGEILNGVSFISWNPLYEKSDISYVSQTTTLPFFKFPYFYSPETLINKIAILDE